ncbi:MAG: hypothetical protein ACEPOW_00400 [Bacteroidales bacterium]
MNKRKGISEIFGEDKTNMLEIEQKVLFRKQKIKITEDGLMTSCQNGKNTKHFSFDHIERKCFINKKRSHEILFFAIALIILFFLSMVLSYTQIIPKLVFLNSAFIVVAFICILLYTLLPINEFCIMLDNRERITLIQNVPTPFEFDEFVNNIYKARNKYIRENYFYIDKSAPFEEELWKLQWLNKEKVISDKEFAIALENIKNSPSGIA